MVFNPAKIPGLNAMMPNFLKPAFAAFSAASEKAAKVTKNRQPQKKTAAPAVRPFDREILSCLTLPQQDNISDSDNEVFLESDEEWLSPSQSARERNLFSEFEAQELLFFTVFL